ncbi:MAG: YaiI/YqxD family protein [Candidatus Methylomirabilales bacterium]
MRIIIDADGCPVKDEVYRIAERHRVRVVLVSNSWMRAPRADWLERVVVDGGFDAADDWIAEHAAAGDIVVTGDIPLAARCLKARARVLDPRGRVHTDDSIGEALANRALLAHLRELGTVTGGPAPVGNRDRSRFMQQLDELLRRAAAG